MNDQEQRMIEYARQWMNYGGGDDEILAEFGLMPEQFYRRLLHLVSTRRVGGPNAEVRGQLGRFSSKKVAAYTAVRTAPIRGAAPAEIGGKISHHSRCGTPSPKPPRSRKGRR